MTLLKRKRLLAAAAETTPGTAVALSASNALFNAYDLMFAPSIPVEERLGSGGDFGYLSSVPGERSATITFKTDMAWDGVEANLQQWATVLLPACGFVFASPSFTPVPSAPGVGGVKSLTMAVYQDGKINKISGAVGTFKINLPTGRMANIEWTFTGVYEAQADGAMITPAHPTDPPLRFASGSVTYNAIELPVENVSIDIGNVITLLHDPTTAAGYSHGIITNRKPIVTANPEACLVATQDRYGALVAGTSQALSIQLSAPGGANITIGAEEAQITNISEADRENVVTDELEFTCLRGSTLNSELSLEFNE